MVCLKNKQILKIFCCEDSQTKSAPQNTKLTKHGLYELDRFHVLRNYSVQQSDTAVDWSIS